MDRAAKMLRTLALLVTVAGIACLNIIHRPADLASVGAAARWFAAGNLPDPVVWICALVAVAGALGARLVEHARPGSPKTVPPAEVLELAAAGGRIEVALEPGGGEVGARLARHLRRRPDVPAFAQDLLSAAVAAGASDVHIQPLDHETRIAWRVGGELAEVTTVLAQHHDPIVRRLKILAELATFQTDLPQDGRFTLELPGRTVDVRVSVLPTRHGEKVVLRLARAGLDLLALDRLGMPEALLDGVRELLTLPQGLIVLTGPTGCGKTSTLYAALAHIYRERGSTAAIATIEDPVEIDVPYLSQTQVDRAAGLGFSDSLRAVLRQDPDVLMIGEIRDRETAAIAVEAGLTGHLILTTLHADSSAGVFNRLIDLGVEPYLVASSVVAVLSQRLARRLCPACRRPAPQSPSQATQLVQRGISRTAAENLSFYCSPGCEACGHTGHRGRTAIFELLRLTPALEELITEKVSTPRLEEAAAGAGMTPLLKAAVLEAVAGTLSLDEALRVAG